MTPNFKIENPHDYSEFIKSDNKIKAILDNLPSELSKLEKAYYIYIELGKIISEDPNYVLRSNTDKDQYYNDSIDENYYGICKSMSELYVELLKDDRVGIEADLIRNVPEFKNKTHVDTVLKIDEKNYIVNLIGDVTNIKSKRRLNSFGIDPYRTLKGKKEELIDIFRLQDASLTYDELSTLIENAEKEGVYESIYELASIYEENEDNRCNEIYKSIRSMAIIGQYIRNINEQYGSVEHLNRNDLEELDVKLKYSFGKIQSENGEHRRGIYTNDVLHKISEELQNPETVKKYIYEGKEIDKSEILDYKIKYICENINKIIEPYDNMTYFDQIMNFKRVADSIVSKEEQERMTVYAVKVGKSYRDIVPILKVKPMNNDGNNTYYLYSNEKKNYCKITAEELKEYLNKFDSKDVHIVGKFREYNKRLDNLNSKKEIENELER